MPTPSQRKRPLADAAQDMIASIPADIGRSSMKDLFKDTLLVGLGAALLTRDKIEESLHKLVQEGKITSQEAKNTAENIFAKGESELKGVQEQMQNFFGSKLRGMDLAARTDVEDLARRYHDLEKQLQAMDIRLNTLEQQRQAESKESGTSEDND